LEEHKFSKRKLNGVADKNKWVVHKIKLCLC